MAGRPKSGITADTDVNLDFLTKEEKDALLSKKMDMIRQRNKMISERHELIEADRRKAEESGNAVKAMDSKTLPAEGAPSKSRGRGRGQGQGQGHRDGNRNSRDRPKSHGDTSSYEPIVDVSDFTVHRTVTDNNNRSNNRGGNKGGQQQQQQHYHNHHPHQDRDGSTSTPKNRRKPHHQKDEAGFRQTTHSSVSPPAMAFDYEPIVDLNDLDHRFGTRGTSSSSPATQTAASKPSIQKDGNNNTRGYSAGGHSRSNRRSDPPDNHSKSKPYSGRLKDNNPPPDPSFNPLSDRRRERGGDRKEGPERSDRSDRPDHKRHPRNYGGGADLAKVKDNMKTMREREKERPVSSRNLEMVMTGRERKNHEQWKQDRERYDNERIQRQMGDAGGWKREWDHDKIVLDYDDQHHSKMEPAKRPAGRIGSGRFDRGDSREDRPKAVVRDGKGGQSQQVQAQQSHHHHPQQQQQQQQALPSHSHHQHAQINIQPPSAQQHQLQQQQQQHADSKPTPRAGRGRGRGRGRGKGVGQGQGPGQNTGGEKSPRPRTWSGGDDRFVECQKEMLVVKFDNTVGDNSVEVEYDDGAPLSPTPSSRSSGSTPGRGPTGRTQNQGGGGSSGSSRSKGGRQQQQQPNQNQQHKTSKGKAGSGRIPSSHNQHSQQQQEQQKQFNNLPRVHHHDQFVDAEWDSTADLNYRHSYDGSIPPNSKVRTLSSHSHSQGDSEEWEDCTESSGALEDDGLLDAHLQLHHQNLHLECQLNPEAPEFLPTSPDFLKTPPGHVKVLNWAGSKSPTSPQSNLSQPELSPRQQQGSESNQSTVSSPGSSASTRAKNRQEVIDVMPEPDEPFPPPFLLNAAELTPVAVAVAEENGDDDDDGLDERAGEGLENGDRSIDQEADDEHYDDDDEHEKFEDSVDNIAENKDEDVSKEDCPSSEESQSKEEKSSSHDGELNGSIDDPSTIEVTFPQPTVNNDETVSKDAVKSAIPADSAEKADIDEEDGASKPICGEGENSEAAILATESSESIEVMANPDSELKDNQYESLEEPPCNTDQESCKTTEDITKVEIAAAEVDEHTPSTVDLEKPDSFEDSIAISTDANANEESKSDSQGESKKEGSQLQPTAEHSASS